MRLAAVIFVAAACANRSAAPSSDLRASDLSIYRAVLDSMFGLHAGRIRQLVLRDSTRVLQGDDLVSSLSKDFSRLPGVDTIAVRDLVVRSREPHSLKGIPPLGIRIPVALVDQRTLGSLPQRDLVEYWRQFYERYPGSNGLIELSAIGYGRSGDLAILMLDQGCGGLCGGGYVIALKRVAGIWRIASIQQTWIS